MTPSNNGRKLGDEKTWEECQEEEDEQVNTYDCSQAVSCDTKSEAS